MWDERRAEPNRPLVIASAALTGVALIGAAIDLFGGLSTSGAPGCASPVAVLFVLLGVVLGYLALAAILAGGGLSLYLSNRSQWGPVLMVVGNFLVMVFFGWGRLLNPGHPFLGATIVVMAGAAPISALLLLWPLLTEGRAWQRILKLLVLGAIAVPIQSYYASSLAWDWSTAMQVPAPIVASSDGPRC